MTSKPSEEFERFDKAMGKIRQLPAESSDLLPKKINATPNPKQKNKLDH